MQLHREAPVALQTDLQRQFSGAELLADRLQADHLPGPLLAAGQKMIQFVDVLFHGHGVFDLLRPLQGTIEDRQSALHSDLRR